MTTSEYIKLNLDKKSYSYAKIYASLLTDEFQRKRAYASLVALYSFVELLEQSPYTVQKSMTLFKNPQLNEQYEISDLYVNGWHLDVRVVTGGDAVLVPKIHFDNDIVPDFYVVIKVDSALENAELVCIIDTENIEKEPFDYHYEAVPFSSLIDYNAFLAKLVIEKRTTHTEEDHELFRTSYLALLDNNIDAETKNKVIKHLFKCSICRTEFCCFTGFEMVCCNTSKYPEVLEDHTLGFVGAQNAEDVKYKGKEETIYIGSDLPTPDETINVQEKTEVPVKDTNVSEILDDLFDMDEGTIQEELLETEENTETKQQAEQVIKENNLEVSSIDDILDEVAIETPKSTTDNAQNIELVSDDTKENNEELQLIDDEIFLDVPSKYPELETTEEGIQIIPDEKTNPYEKNENLELISEDSDEEKKIIEQTEDEEIFVINDENKEDYITDISDENAIIEEKDELIELSSPEDEIQEVYPSDEEFVINNEDDKLESIDDEIIDEATMLSQEDPVQKVIVDYDENGEPIYSYITDIEQEDKSPTDETSLFEEQENDDFIEYKDDEETVSEIEDISDDQNDEEEYESVYADNEEILSNEDELGDEQLDTTENNSKEEIDYKEDDEPLEYYEEEEEVEQQPSIIDDILYNTSNKNEEEYLGEDTDKDFEEDVEFIDRESTEEDGDTIEDNTESDEEMIDYNDDMNEEEYDEDGEYDDYDLEDHLPDENVKKSTSPLSIIIAIIVILSFIGGGVFLFLTKGKTAQEETPIEALNENVVETTENVAVNDMFEEPIVAEDKTAVPVPQGEAQTEKQNTEQNTTEVANNVSNSMFEEQLPAPTENASMPELKESDLIKPVERKSNGDASKTMVNAFATNTSPVSLKALNWFCASELFSDIDFKNYLQTVDNTLKQNLKNNFMNLLESSPKDSVAAKFAIDNRGNLKKVIISESSGSEEIDNVVLQSINETFEREKSQILNDNELKQDMYYLKVVIKL